MYGAFVWILTKG